LAEGVKQGKSKLAKAAKIVAMRPSPKKPVSGEAKKSGVEIKRHDERMKSARYKLEAFVRDYSDMAEWKEVIEASKHSLERNMSDSLFHPSAGICLPKAEPLAHSMT
jgi:hypothetical protein